MLSDFYKLTNKDHINIPKLLQCVVGVILFLLLVIMTFNYIPNKEIVMKTMEKIQHIR